jgi:hypothetical protein
MGSNHVAQGRIQWQAVVTSWAPSLPTSGNIITSWSMQCFVIMLCPCQLLCSYRLSPFHVSSVVTPPYFHYSLLFLIFAAKLSRIHYHKFSLKSFYGAELWGLCKEVDSESLTIFVNFANCECVRNVSFVNMEVDLCSKSTFSGTFISVYSKNEGYEVSQLFRKVFVIGENVITLLLLLWFWQGICLWKALTMGSETATI